MNVLKSQTLSLDLFKWREAAQYVYNEFLSKEYASKVIPEDLEFTYQDITIPRPNHGLAHTLRVTSLVSFVVKAYNAFNHPPVTSEDVEHIQLALLFYVVGRENEASFTSHKSEYLRAREKSATAFESYVKNNPEIKLTQERIHFYKQGILNAYSTSPPQYIVIRICHDLDLIRCYPQDKYHEKLKEASIFIGCLTSSLAQLAEECLSQTGNRIMGKVQYNGPLFIRCNRSVDEALKGINAAIQLKQNNILNQLKSPLPEDFQAPVPSTPWYVSPQLWNRIPKEDSSQTYQKCEILPSDPEAAFVLLYFMHSKPPKYSIKKIYVVHSATQTLNFENGIKSLEQEAHNPIFTPKKEEPKDQRARAIARWMQSTNPFSPVMIKGPKRNDEIKYAKVLPLWHGSTQTKCQSICESGFTYFGQHHHFSNAAKEGDNKSTDIGFFGSGIYFSSSAHYASMYNNGNLLLSWVSMREPYPVINDVQLPSKGSDMKMLEGKGAYQNYSAHYIPVTSINPSNPDCMLYYPCDKNQLATWDEYVVFNKQHTLPRFWIELALDTPEHPLKDPFLSTDLSKKAIKPSVASIEVNPNSVLTLKSSMDLGKISQYNRIKINRSFALDTGSLVELSKKLQNVTEIDCSGSGLTDTSLAALCPNKQVSLQKINLSKCSLTDKSLISLRNFFPNLNSINLSFCKLFTDSGLSALANSYPGLTSLNLEGCTQLSDEGLINLANYCPGLSSLNLSKCQGISEIGLFFLAESCRGLTSLNLANCSGINVKNLTGDFKSFPKLTYLNLSLNELTDTILMLFVKLCPELISVDLLSTSNLTDTGVIALAKSCPKLTSLNLLGCTNITESGLNAIAQFCSGLTSLSLDGGNKFTETSLSTIGKLCSGLTSLNFSDTTFKLFERSGFTDNLIISIAEFLPSLTSIILTNCHAITDPGLTAIAQKCPNLISICLNEGERLTDIGLIALAKSCPGLTSLNLAFCSKLTDAGVIVLAKSCPGLTALCLNGCKMLTDNGLIALAQSCPGLTSLYLAKCSSLTDTGIINLAKSCPGLNTLSLAYCSKLTDASLTSLAKSCPGLASINLRGCTAITDAGLNALIECCPELTSIDLTECAAITNAKLIALTKSFPDLNFNRKLWNN